MSETSEIMLKQAMIPVSPKKTTAAGKELADLNKRFRATFEQAAVGIAHVGLDGRFIRVNRRYCRLLGYTKSELTRKTFQEITHPDDLEADLKQTRKLYLGKIDHYSIEKRYLRKNGTSVWVNMTGSCVRDSARKPEYYIAVVEDISKRKLTEEALQKSEERFHALADNIPNLAWMAKPDGYIYWYNKRWYEYTGTTPKQMEGWGWKKVHHPKTLPKVLARWKQSLKHGGSFNMVFPLKGKDGVYRLFLTLVMPVKDKRGHVLHWFGTNTDITMQVKAEQALRQNQQMFNAFLSAIDNYLFIFDRKNRFIFANKVLLDLWGVSAGDIVGKSMRDLHYQPEVEQAILEGIRQVKATEKTFRNETYYTSPATGHSAYYQNILSPIFNSKGNLTMIAGSSYDITDHKEAENKRDEFVSIASHELKTPITSLKGYAQILEKRLGEANDTENRRLVMRMETQVDRLTGLVSQLLDVTKIQAGKLVLPKAPFDLNELVREVVTDIGNTVGKRFNITVKGTIRQDILGDRFRVEQVLINLITNAIKYSHHSYRITITLRTVKKQAEVAVKDYGIGIPKDEQAHIFDRFFQAKAARTNEGRMSSLGLGLYISAQIIKGHGGKIWVESRYGKGSTFRFTLPIAV